MRAAPGWLLVVCLIELVGAGCDPVAHPGYRGEPLFALAGRTIDSGGMQVPVDWPDAPPAIVWFDVGETQPTAFLAEHSETFLTLADADPPEPSAFRLSVYGPPYDQQAALPEGGDGLRGSAPPALGAVVLLDSEFNAFGGPRDEHILAIHEDHFLAYNPGDEVLDALGAPLGVSVLRAQPREVVEPAEIEPVIIVDAATVDVRATLASWLTP